MTAEHPTDFKKLSDEEFARALNRVLKPEVPGERAMQKEEVLAQLKQKVKDLTGYEPALCISIERKGSFYWRSGMGYAWNPHTGNKVSLSF